MTYEYRCLNGHIFEQFFTSFKQAERFLTSAPCPMCLQVAQRVVSKPLLPHLYGDPAGYGKPSPTKRHSTKLVSTEGNDSAIG
jgi:hypothetical protein